jgi:predicted esterase
LQKFSDIYPNAEIYIYGFSAGFNVFFNSYLEVSIELQKRFKGIVFGSPAPDPSSAAFYWCIDLLANLPMTASIDDKLAEVRRFSCIVRLKNNEISQKLRIVLMKGTIDELVTIFDFQNFKEILDAKSFVKTILYYGVGHSIPWNPTIEQLKAIETLNVKNQKILEN